MTAYTQNRCKTLKCLPVIYLRNFIPTRNATILLPFGSVILIIVPHQKIPVDTGPIAFFFLPNGGFRPGPVTFNASRRRGGSVASEP